MGTTTVDFGDVEAKLRTYLKATGAQMAPYVRRAISEHIDAELANNPGVKDRFEGAMAKVVSEAGGNVAILIPRRRKRGAG